MYKNEEILKPTSYTPTDKDIALAKAHYVMKNYLFGMTQNLSKFYEIHTEDSNLTQLKTERIKELAEHDYKIWKKVKSNLTTSNLFDAFISDEEFNHHFVKALSSMHLGDCTSFPMTCDRCYAESLFQLPYSATFTQQQGEVLLDQFLTDYEEKTGKKYEMPE